MIALVKMDQYAKIGMYLDECYCSKVRTRFFSLLVPGVLLPRRRKPKSLGSCKSKLSVAPRVN